MLKNAYLLAKIGADTAENERKFAQHLAKISNYLATRRLRQTGRTLSRPVPLENRAFAPTREKWRHRFFFGYFSNLFAKFL